MDKNLMKFLEFRTELIELLDKYSYIMDANECGEISISNNDNSILYSLVNEELTAFDLDNYISTDYILENFSEDCKFNNKDVGVFTNSYWKAIMLFNELSNNPEVKSYKKSKTNLEIIMNDSTRYEWITPKEQSKGNRCSYAYIDRDITLNELHYIILPICVLYTKRENVKIF